jgi:D-beta-D-heptose 7-phosphate kinase/D-beta-D-heptose 1-phosphate adenosyltransferase
VLAHLPGCHAVVLSDYAKGVLTPEVCQLVIQAARKLGIPVLVDPKSADFPVTAALQPSAPTWASSPRRCISRRTS